MKLYRFRWSPFARKVQILLDLLGARYETIDVPYSDRTELATVTGGYVYVPVLVDEAGKVITESRDICEHLLAGEAAKRFTPSPYEGPIWAYADFCDGPLEDVMFRIASPVVREAYSPSDRALYVLIKERKFGAGCVDAWQRDQAALIAKAQRFLRPTLRTLAARPFLFGDAPTPCRRGAVRQLQDGGGGRPPPAGPYRRAADRVRTQAGGDRESEPVTALQVGERHRSVGGQGSSITPPCGVARQCPCRRRMRS